MEHKALRAHELLRVKAEGVLFRLAGGLKSSRN